MEEYWNMISSGHQRKLLFLARQSGVDSETAMRNIVNYLKQDDSKRPEYFKDFITGKNIEGMIDMISLSHKQRTGGNGK